MKQEMTAVQKIARVLRVLVTITLVCNLLALLLVPFLADQRFQFTQQETAALLRFDFAYFGSAWYLVWRAPYTAVLTVFLWLCGGCTAVILRQARLVLDTVLRGEPFSGGNAAHMKRAGICCLIIAAAALVRLVWGFCYYRSITPLLTYNALFVPVFAMGFLLCMVMSALFRQAAELKEENDLTI